MPPVVPALPPDVWTEVLVRHGPLSLSAPVGADVRYVAIRRLQRGVRLFCARVRVPYVEGTEVMVRTPWTRGWERGKLMQLSATWVVRIERPHPAIRLLWLPNPAVRLRRCAR